MHSRLDFVAPAYEICTSAVESELHVHAGPVVAEGGRFDWAWSSGEDDLWDRVGL